MPISFKGYQNVGTSYINNKNEKYIHMNMELTNKNGKDLDEFQPILKKNPNYINKNYLDIKYVKLNVPQFPNMITSALSINDNVLPITDANLGTISKVAKLARRISNDEKPLNASEEYVTGQNCQSIFGGDLRADRDESYQEQLETFHSDDTIKTGAHMLDKAIEKRMIDYIG